MPPDADRELFDRLMAAAPADRAKLLYQLCDDVAVCRRVEALFAAYAKAADGLADPTAPIASDTGPTAGPAPLALPIERIGRYRILQLIGEGGFGSVYIAEQEGPLRRRVAIKVIKPGMDSRQVIARFEQERHVLALMDHPNIARVFDAGQTLPPDSRPYFVMEYIRGEPVTGYCDRHRLSVRDRLRLFAQACDALHYAHMKGIIHRDLKPSNILVCAPAPGASGAGSGTPQVKIIDFGVAKATAHRLSEATVYTEIGQIIGTPEYMSPEQAEMSGADIDTRTDVYALGVILYELLTGTLPFDSATLRAAGYAGIQKTIRQVEPPRPSTRLSVMGESAAAAAAARQSRVDELVRQLRSELEWIPLKAMRKDRAERYRSAAELGDDIANYLTGRALIAGPESTAYQLRKLLRRHKGPAIAAAAVFLALLLGLGGTLWQARRAADRAAAADTARTRAEGINQFLWKTLQSADPYTGGRQDARVVDVMMAAVADLDAGCFKDDPRTEAALRGLIGDVLISNGRAAEAEPLIVKSLELFRRLYTGDHAAIAATLHNLADARALLGRQSEAEILFRESLDMCRRLTPGDDPDVATTMDDLARLLRERGSFEEAESMCLQALEMRRRLHPPPIDDSDIAVSFSNLAQIKFKRGQVAQAEALNVQALDMRRRLYAGDHPNIARSLLQLAYARETLGRAAEAEPLFVEALNMRRRLFKGDHPDIAESLVRLGAVRDVLGRPAEGEPLLLEALAMYRRFYTGDHPMIAVSLKRLAALRASNDRPAEAIPPAQEGLEMTRRLYNGDHTDIAGLLSVLGQARLALDQKVEAQSLFQQSLDMHRRMFVGDHPEIAANLNNLGRARHMLGRPADAEPLLHDAVAMARRLYEGDHPDTAIYSANLALCLKDLNRLDEARPLAIHAAEMLLRVFPPDHPEVRKVLARKHEVCGD